MTQRVLIVEDERDLATVLAYNLRADGLEVATAETGAAAYREVQAKVPDLIILDLMLPDVSGLDICRTLKANPQTRDVPIIIAAIDPCFSCTDRMVQVHDTGHGRRETLSWQALHAYSLDWHRKQGIDFKALNEKLRGRLN